MGGGRCKTGRGGRRRWARARFGARPPKELTGLLLKQLTLRQSIPTRSPRTWTSRAGDGGVPATAAARWWGVGYPSSSVPGLRALRCGGPSASWTAIEPDAACKGCLCMYRYLYRPGTGASFFLPRARVSVSSLVSVDSRRSSELKRYL